MANGCDLLIETLRSMGKDTESAGDLAGYLRKCSLCDSTGVMAPDLYCPRCGGPDSVERRAAASLERLAFGLQAILDHKHTGPCDHICTNHMKFLASQALTEQPINGPREGETIYEWHQRQAT